MYVFTNFDLTLYEGAAAIVVAIGVKSGKN